MVIKNFWSLNVDEAIVADKIKKELGNNFEVFLPLNSQLKDIDLIVYNLKNKKSLSIQVKGSRTYIPSKSQKERFGDGKTSWNVIKSSSIFRPDNKIDFFIFVMHQEELSNNNRKIKQNYIVIPINDFQKITKKEKIERKTGYYHFSYIVQNQKVLEINNTKGKSIDFSKYLNSFHLLEKNS